MLSANSVLSKSRWKPRNFTLSKRKTADGRQYSKDRFVDRVRKSVRSGFSRGAQIFAISVAKLVPSRFPERKRQPKSRRQTSAFETIETAIFREPRRSSRNTGAQQPANFRLASLGYLHTKLDSELLFFFANISSCCSSFSRSSSLSCCRATAGWIFIRPTWTMPNLRAL